MTDYSDNIAHIRGVAPFWFVNGEIIREQVASEFDEMHLKGIHTVIVHPRYGLAVDYLSDDWFEIFGWCVEEAKARDMHIWIYDELNWPSGTAGMTVQAGEPEYMSKHLSVTAVLKADIDLSIFQPGQFLLAGRVEAGRLTKTKVLSDMMSLRALSDDWTVFNCRIVRDQYYIDTLSKAAVDRFKERTHEEYRKRFGNEFGKTIQAVFTDEPSIYWVSVGYDDWTIPYTEKLFQSFEEKYKYSAIPLLPYLFYPGQAAPAFRADFWAHVSDLFNTNYHANLGGWCRENGLIYTGHAHFEEPLRYQIRFTGDMFGTMKEFDIPGVDHLGKTTLGNDINSIIGHKIASSSAHTSGKPKVLSESFGLTGWDVTFQDLKKVVDWQFANGINLISPHALFHSIAGPVKHESPPTYFTPSPQWENFDAFTEYIDRLSETLTGGKHICKIAVLYPLSGLFAAYQPDKKTQEFEAIDSILNQLCIELMMRQLDYDLIDFHTLSDAQTENGQIVIAEERYDVLLIPYTPYMRPNEYQTIADLAKQVETHFFYRTVDPVASNIPSSSGGVKFEATEDLQNFVMRLRHSIDDGVHLNGDGREDISILQREKDGNKIVFLVNRSEHSRKIEARFTGQVGLTIIEPETGKSRPLPGKIGEKKTETVIHFAPYQSWIIQWGEHIPLQEAHTEDKPKEIQINDLSVETGENIAILFDFKHNGEKIDIRMEPRFIPVNWDASPPDFSRFAGTYEAKLQVKDKPSPIRLVLDQDYAECKITVNGSEVMLLPCQNCLTGATDLSADVTELLRDGENVIQVVSPTKLSEPLRFAGDFDVILDHEQVTIIPRSERNLFKLEETMPFYSGTVTYTAKFDLSDQPERLELDLHDVHDSATVYLNGTIIGKRLWAPYIFDLTKHAKTGQNELKIEVRNNLANLIIGKHSPFGLREQPTIFHIVESD